MFYLVVTLSSLNLFIKLCFPRAGTATRLYLSKYTYTYETHLWFFDSCKQIGSKSPIFGRMNKQRFIDSRKSLTYLMGIYSIFSNAYIVSIKYKIEYNSSVTNL